MGAADGEDFGRHPVVAADPRQRLQQVQQVQQVRRTSEETPTAFLRRQAAMHDLVWVVAPESGGVLASLRAAVADRQWLGCSRQAIDIAGSKRATAALLGAAGIATPLGIVAPCATQPATEAARSGGAARWVVKPDDGCGAVGVRRHDDYDAACADHAGRLLRHSVPVMEPWIDGEPLSVAMLCEQRDVEVLAVNRQRLTLDDKGWISFDGVSVNAVGGTQAQAVAALARQVWSALPGLWGFVGIDVTWHPARGPVVIEVNPRVTCAYEGLSASLGFNVAQRMLALHRQ